MVSGDQVCHAQIMPIRTLQVELWAMLVRGSGSGVRPAEETLKAGVETEVSSS